MPKGVYNHKKHTEDRKRKISESLKGRKLSESVKINMSNAQKGKYKKYEEELKRSAIHWRIEQKLGKPKYCEHCKKTDKKKYHWSNKDHKYSLDIKFWQRLCSKCHKIYDMKFNGSKK